MNLIDKLYTKMKSDARFFGSDSDLWIELHQDPETGEGYSIDFHEVADFTLWEGRKCLAITPTFKTKAMLDFLDFLEENRIKKFHEVSFFGDDGVDFALVKEYRSGSSITDIYYVRRLVQAIADRDKA